MSEFKSTFVEEFKEDTSWRDKDAKVDYLRYYNEEIVEFYDGEARKNGKAKEDFFALINNKTMAKAFKEAALEEVLTPKIVTMLFDFLTNYLTKQEDFNKEAPFEDKKFKWFSEAMDLVAKPRIEKIESKTGLSSDLLMELVPVVPVVPNVKELKWKVFQVLNRLYGWLDFTQPDYSKVPEEERLTLKQLKKLFKQLFGKENMDEVAKYILLENNSRISQHKESSQAVSRLLTVVALDTLEDGSKSDIADALKSYINIRKADEKKGRNAQRRCNLLKASDHGKVYKVVNKLIDANAENEKYLA